MHRRQIPIILIGLLLVLSLALMLNSAKRPLTKEKRFEMKKIDNWSLLTVFDNYRSQKNLETGWGFSCLLEVSGDRILFDTGANGTTLLSNMEELEIDPQSLDAVFLSHRHGDHTAGLPAVLEENANVTVYLLQSFPQRIKQEVQQAGAEMVEVSSSQRIMPGVISTGPLPGPPQEQSLMINTERGLVIVTGCAHPGIVNIVKKAKKMTGEDVYLVLGGFHLSSAPDSKLQKIIASFRELGVETAAPCHCSGQRARELFAEEYKGDYIANGVGQRIETK